MITLASLLIIWFFGFCLMPIVIFLLERSFSKE